MAYSFIFSADNDYETGSGNRCEYVGDDEDYNDEGSGKDLTRFFIIIYTHIGGFHLVDFIMTELKNHLIC